MSYNPPDISDDAKKIAKKFFERAATVAETRNYDYAIELYLQGLSKDPEAVEEGHKPLREVALRRKLTGGKKPGLMETIKRTRQKKNPAEAFMSAEFLLSKDPFNVAYADELAKYADRAELPEALAWALQVYLELTQQQKKLNVNRFVAIRKYYEKLGDYFDQTDQPDRAVDCYERGTNALSVAINSGLGRNLDLTADQRDLAGKLTILRGKYERAEDFRASIKDAEGQKDLYDRGRTVKSEELLEDMITKARTELQAQPDVSGKIVALTDLLLQRGTDEDFDETITVLEDAFERLGQYSFKMRADDVRIRQRKGKLDDLKAQLEQQGAADPAQQAEVKRLDTELRQFELQAYRQRAKEYPTDMRIKFEYGRRLYAAGQYDEAIPVFQDAVGDPKNTVRARYYIGTCFFQKGWHSQAADVLNKAIEGYEFQGDQLSREMHYVLARAYEEQDQIEQALNVYSKLIQWDFNYRDVKDRIDALQSKKNT